MFVPILWFIIKYAAAYPHRIRTDKLVLFSLIAALLGGCGLGRITIIVTATASPAMQITATPFPTSTSEAPTPSDTPSESATESSTSATIAPTAASGISLWRAANVPPEYQEALSQLVAAGNYRWAEEDAAQIKLVVGEYNGKRDAEWLYVPVVPFATVADDVKWADIQRYWQGDTAALSYLSSNNKPPIFVTSPEIRTWLVQLLGEPSPAVAIESVPPDGIITTLWLKRPGAWAIVPFHRLDPAMKALTLDGANIFDRGLDTQTYPLTQPFSFTGDEALLETIRQDVTTASRWMPTNRDLSKMTILVMTGVTALARATAFQMENTGITLPARDILPFVQDADIVHTSNEVAFAEDCPYPDPGYTSVNIRFCSKESYFDLLKTMRIGVVELTGNHVNDWGAAALVNSIELYNANNVKYFGGGLNDEDAKKSLLMTSNGNTIAFIGCNPAGPQPAWAKADTAGSAKCDEAFITDEIARLKAAGHIVIMSLQYQEYYHYAPTNDQIAYFQKYASLGADLVMGAQAHAPQGFAFTGTSFIHYGYGNLFFDQMDALITRQMFADKLIIYNNKHINTVLFTGIIEDYSRPRPMTIEERQAFLKAVFEASGW